MFKENQSINRYLIENRNNLFHVFLLQLVWGKKEFVFISMKQKAFIANLCTYPVLDWICIQSIFFAVGRNDNNLNVVGRRYILYIKEYPYTKNGYKHQYSTRLCN